MGPAAAYVDGAEVALAAVVYRDSWYSNLLLASLVMASLVRCLLLLMLPWFLSGSLLWLLWYTLELEPMYPWYSVGVS